MRETESIAPSTLDLCEERNLGSRFFRFFTLLSITDHECFHALVLFSLLQER